MKRQILSFAVLVSLVLTGAAWAERKVQDYSTTIDEFKQSKDVAPFFDTAYAYAVFPTIGKAGLGIGASRGKGQVYRDGKVAGFTALTNVSIGWQAGGQAYSQVIFFENESAYHHFTRGNFEFDAQASAIVIQASASASAGTEGGSQAGASTGGAGGSQANQTYYKGTLVFVIGKGGLMYEAALAGQKYSFKPVE